jgi:hypothetical protein
MEKGVVLGDPKGKKLLSGLYVEDRKRECSISPFHMSSGAMVELPSDVVVIQSTFSFDTTKQFDDELSSDIEEYQG